MSDTKYCYPDSDVLINKLDIKDKDKLQKFERKLTMIRLSELFDNPIKGNLKNEKYLSGLDKEEFAKRLAYYFSEINALHPFREGNGRVQREFIRSLALKNGYVIRFDRISEGEMIRASQESFLCNYDYMEKLFTKCTNKM